MNNRDTDTTGKNGPPVGWIRGGKIAGSPEVPDEYDWEVRRGQSRPPGGGGGWKPIYTVRELESLS